VDDLLLKAKPGLSAFADDPSAAASSLDSLIDFAREKVPESQHGETPAFLMASAGLRALTEEKAEAILDAVRNALWESPFLFLRKWAYIMSGREEGVFGWVTVNYLRQTLKDAGESTGVIDLGGGSVQIVYHLPSGVKAPEQNTGRVLHGGLQHDLYVGSHSHGLDQARRDLLESLPINPEAPVEHPCLLSGSTVTEQRQDGTMQSYTGSGSFNDCGALYRKQFEKGAPCPVPPCSFGGVFQPDLPAQIFGFSYLFDRTRAIGLLDGVAEIFGTQTMSVEDIERAATALCSLPSSEAAKRFTACSQCNDAEKWENFCGDATYLSVLLHDGFGIHRTTKLTMGNKLRDIEIVWTLGAMIANSGSVMDADLAEDYSKAVDEAIEGFRSVGADVEELEEKRKDVPKTREEVHSGYQGLADMMVAKILHASSPSCGPANLDVCDVHTKAQIEKFSQMSPEDLEAAMKTKNDEIEKLEEDFETYTDGLLKSYKEAGAKLEKDQEASGLSLMKAVAAHKMPVKSEL
jgi:hypothetical protein